MPFTLVLGTKISGRLLFLSAIFRKITGCGLNKQDKAGDTRLHKAAREGNVRDVKKFLSEGTDPNKKNEAHMTALHIAAYWGEEAIVTILLQYDAVVDADNGHGWTALHSAAIAGGLKSRKGVIELLLAAGASLTKQDKYGWTPQDYMTLWEENETVAEKLKNYLAKTPTPPVPPRRPTSTHMPKH